MKWFFNRITEASSLGGIGMMLASAPAVIASKGMDQQSLALFIGGLGAFLKPEAKKAE